MGKKELIMDSVEVVGKTALSVIPVGGALVTAVYDVIKGNALAKRHEKWKQALEERLSKVEETLEKIGDNELFATALVKTTELAMKTAKEEKMQYLANAVVNSLKSTLDEDRLLVFLTLLDKYTVSHIKIINFFYMPTRFDGVSRHTYSMGSPTNVLFSVYPELNNELFDKIYNDLYTDGMVNTPSLNITMSGSGMVAKRTTKLGDDFLQFIQEKENISADVLYFY